MKYISTRGQAPALDFEDVVIAGLASDGGLYVPEVFPEFTHQEIASFAGLSYQELALRVMLPFVEGSSINEATLKQLIDESYQSFRHTSVTPLIQTGNQEFVLELFHGPTLAFKDVALQFLGRMFDHILTKRNEHVTIIGATSGDTGSAAIEGCRHSKHVDIFIMHPYQKISEVQRRQMTTVVAGNIHNMAIESDFDFCQDAAKAMFRDPSFVEDKTKLVAINSINWCRILAQIVYYFYSALHLGAPQREVSFAVPTGNFGDVFAGYVAKKMGLPIKQLVIATNANNILDRFMESKTYERGTLLHTLTPSMDIQVSSNFERLLFDMYDNNGEAVNTLMEQFKTRSITIDDVPFEKICQTFSSLSLTDEETCGVVRAVYEDTGVILDPHTAIGVEAGRQRRQDKTTPMVCLATAHPAKFVDAIVKAGVPEAPLPEHLQDILNREEQYSVLPKDLDEIKSFIAKRCGA